MPTPKRSVNVAAAAIRSSAIFETSLSAASVKCTRMFRQIFGPIRAYGAGFFVGLGVGFFPWVTSTTRSKVVVVMMAEPRVMLKV